MQYPNLRFAKTRFSPGTSNLVDGYHPVNAEPLRRL